MIKYGNGVMPLSVGKRTFWIAGGPYAQKPNFAFGVRMTEWSYHSADVAVPTKDFSTPPRELVLEALPKIMKAMTQGRTVYIGCMGGWGRTGLMLSLVAKAWGVKNPVAYVRSTYHTRAVENAVQERYVSEFKIPIGMALKFWAMKQFIRLFC